MINTQRGIVFSSSTTETVVPYCPPDEDLAGWIEREGDALSAAFNGDGVFNGERLDVERFWDWFVQQTSKNVHVVMGQVGYWSGAFLCTGFEASGAGRREKVQFSGSFISDGPIVWVATT
jgi:predicted secreted protein